MGVCLSWVKGSRAERRRPYGQRWSRAEQAGILCRGGRPRRPARGGRPERPTGFRGAGGAAGCARAVQRRAGAPPTAPYAAFFSVITTTCGGAKKRSGGKMVPTPLETMTVVFPLFTTPVRYFCPYLLLTTGAQSPKKVTCPP